MYSFWLPKRSVGAKMELTLWPRLLAWDVLTVAMLPGFLVGRWSGKVWTSMLLAEWKLTLMGVLFQHSFSRITDWMREMQVMHWCLFEISIRSGKNSCRVPWRRMKTNAFQGPRIWANMSPSYPERWFGWIRILVCLSWESLCVDWFGFNCEC